MLLGFSIDGASFALNADRTFTLSHTYAAAGSFTVTVTVTDDDGDSHSDSFLVNVLNVAPTVGPITAPLGPVQISLVHADPAALEAKLPDFMQRNFARQAEQYQLYLQPLSDVYLGSSDLLYTTGQRLGNRTYVYVFSAIALLILFIGVVSVVSGYTGGRVANPTYGAVSSGTTGHVEAVEVVYNPAKVSYERLLEVFWRNIDPTNDRGQFCDIGEQYRSAIFFHDAAQQQAALASKEQIEKVKTFRVVTEISPAGPFFKAEEYHQDYYKKNPVRYRFYRFNCSRDRRLRQVWGDLPPGHSPFAGGRGP